MRLTKLTILNTYENQQEEEFNKRRSKILKIGDPLPTTYKMILICSIMFSIPMRQDELVTSMAQHQRQRHYLQQQVLLEQQEEQKQADLLKAQQFEDDNNARMYDILPGYVQPKSVSHKPKSNGVGINSPKLELDANEDDAESKLTIPRSRATHMKAPVDNEDAWFTKIGNQIKSMFTKPN